MNQATAAVFQWPPTSYHGWGVYGLNLALNWAGEIGFEAICSVNFDAAHIAVDPLRRRALDSFINASADFRSALKQHTGQALRVSLPVLTPVGADFVLSRAAHDVALQGSPTIGVTFLETSALSHEAVQRASQLALIVAGSTWNERVLREAGLSNVRTVLQGVDPDLFHPAPTKPVLPDRFLVFSGGKLERRKGQDLVLAAFARFARTRPDATLVTAWGNLWPHLTAGLEVSGLVGPVPRASDGRADIGTWTAENGLLPDQVLHLNLTANSQMAPLLRQMNVAVFPNRAEGGTNLVAMEAMACGVPTILSANTGHLDLIQEGNCLALRDQTPLIRPSEQGWCDSSVAEIVECLERAYEDRDGVRARGLAGAETLKRLTWHSTASEMRALVSEAARAANT